MYSDIHCSLSGGDGDSLVERDNYCIFCWTPVANMSTIWGISGSFQGFPISTAQWTSSPSRVHFPCCKQKTMELRFFYMRWFSLWIHQKKTWNRSLPPGPATCCEQLLLRLTMDSALDDRSSWMAGCRMAWSQRLLCAPGLCFDLFWFPWIAEDCVKCIEML